MLQIVYKDSDKNKGKLQKVESDLEFVLNKIDSHLVDEKQEPVTIKNRIWFRLRSLFRKRKKQD